MLYVTTTDQYDAVTVSRSLSSDLGADGGFYVPFRIPSFEMEQLKDLSFGQCVAEVLNRFFSCRLTVWDVEFAVGRYPLKIASAGNRILAAELWRNLDESYQAMEEALCKRILENVAPEGKCTSWLRICVRIAILFGVFAELLRQQTPMPVDVAVSADDFSLVMAVWYARQMGLPVNTLICGCSDEGVVWDLLHNGQAKLDGSTDPEMERLIHGVFGVSEAKRFRDVRNASGSYSLLPENASRLREGIFSAVVSADRVASVVSNVYRTSSYSLPGTAAKGYGGLMDYRARTGESREALLLCDQKSSKAE